MSRIQEAVLKFANKPLTHEVEIMSKFGFEWDWMKEPVAQRTSFLTTIREAGRVEEFCDYILGVSDEVSTV